MQWRFDGTPTWRAPKWFALWALLPIMLFVRLVIFLSATYTPENTHHVELGIAIFSLIACASHIFILAKATRES
jgi:hypothetical protein